MSELAKANLNDDETIDALDKLSDEHGSKAEAIRHAIQQAAGSDDGSTTDDEPQTVADQLSESSLKKALRKLWEIARRDGGRDDMGYTSSDAAMSVLAQEFSVNKAAVKPMFLTPLKAANVIDMESGNDQTIIYVVDPDDDIAGDDDELTNYSDDDDTITTDDDSNPTIDDPDDADDRLAEIDAAEAVRADGGATQ